MNPYQLLNVDQNATESEIKKSYKTLAKKWHPDKHVNSTEQEQIQSKFINITHAYNILSNERERKKYDMGLETDYEMKFDNEFINKHIINRTCMINNIENISLNHKVDFCELYNDSYAVINYSYCDSKGVDTTNIIRYNYNRNKMTNSINFEIINSIECDRCIKIYKMGNEKEGLRGDIILNLFVEKNDYIINKNQITLTVKITLCSALCGFTKNIKLPNGKVVTIKSKRIIEPFQRLILNEMGLMNNGKRDLLIVVFDIIFPKLNGNQIVYIKKILKEKNEVNSIEDSICCINI